MPTRDLDLGLLKIGPDDPYTTAGPELIVNWCLSSWLRTAEGGGRRTWRAALRQGFSGEIADVQGLRTQ